MTTTLAMATWAQQRHTPFSKHGGAGASAPRDRCVACRTRITAVGFILQPCTAHATRRGDQCRSPKPFCLHRWPSIQHQSAQHLLRTQQLSILSLGLSQSTQDLSNSSASRAHLCFTWVQSQQSWTDYAPPSQTTGSRQIGCSSLRPVASEPRSGALARDLIWQWACSVVRESESLKKRRSVDSDLD